MSGEPIFREDRYLVLKRRDLAVAIEFYTEEEQDAFYRVCKSVELVQARRGKPPTPCLVVESSWGIYPAVWKLIELQVESDRSQDLEEEEPEYGN